MQLETTESLLAEIERLRIALDRADLLAHQLTYAARRLAAAWRAERQRVAEQDEQIAELAALAAARED